jgi:CubicO group peptidase (beta-lactamase class C family)
MKPNTWIAFLFISFTVAFLNDNSVAQPLSTVQIDSLVARTMKAFEVPGIAVAIIQDNRIIHAKGYGVRSLNSKGKVDANTLFGIASNSKAFTTAALGILVDERKLNWDDKVIDFIPEFRLYSPYVTEEFTIRDLLTHRSGLGLGAGDLMIFPGNNNFTKNDIIHNLRYLKPVSGFRTKFDYDNLLYIVAGEVVARVSGMSWDDFIEKRIMKPLNMNSSASNYNRLKDKSNVIDPHAPVNGVVQVVNRDFSENCDAAGGIYSNLTDMCSWVMMQLNNGKYGESNDKQLFSKSVHDMMWSPQTIIQVGDSTDYNTHFGSYGLGWFISDARGFKQISHTGGLAGIVTQVTLIPELQLGIIVLTNQQSGAAFTSITNTIKDGYFGISGIDRVKQYHEAVRAYHTNASELTDEIWKDIDKLQQSNPAGPVDSLYTGTYTDQWFGEVIVSLKNGKLWFDSERSPTLTGQLFSYKGNTFVVKWNDRSMEADAFVMFDLDESGKAAGMKMKAISPLTDFSFDFQDLDFHR